MGSFSIKWYGLAYAAGILMGWQYCRLLIKNLALEIRPLDVDDLIPWLAFGIVLGGRLGHVLFYDLDYYLSNPHEILFIWQPGMSFHGGLLGVVAALSFFTHKRRIPFIDLSDIIAAATPIGLFFGRIANFINGELYGRITSVSWAMIFPHGGPFPRHPSQLYEAIAEGLVLFGILAWLCFRQKWLNKRPGGITGVFLIGYALARIMIECWREPDHHIGLFAGNTTLGQWLSLPLLFFGFVLSYSAVKNNQHLNS